MVASHFGKIAFPEARAREFQDPACFDAADEILEGPLDDPRVGSFSAQSDGLLQESFIEHKSCTFHTYGIHEAPEGVNPLELGGRPRRFK